MLECMLCVLFVVLFRLYWRCCGSRFCILIFSFRFLLSVYRVLPYSICMTSMWCWVQSSCRRVWVWFFQCRDSSNRNMVLFRMLSVCSEGGFVAMVFCCQFLLGNLWYAGFCFSLWEWLGFVFRLQRECMLCCVCFVWCSVRVLRLSADCSLSIKRDSR